MKKILLIIFVVLIVLMILSVQFIKNDNYEKKRYDNYEPKYYDSYEEMAAHGEKIILDKAEKNANKYIQKKYGFTPKFTEKEADYETKNDRSGGLIFNVEYKYTGNVMLKFEKDSKEYFVLISGLEDSLLGYDNYQHEEIEKKIIDEFYSMTGNLPYDCEILYGEIGNVGDLYAENLVNEFFNGENLESVIADSRVLFECPENVNFNDISVDFLGDENTTLILKYKSEEDFEQAQNDYKGNYHGTTMIQTKKNIFFIDDTEIIHIDEMLLIENGEKELKTINWIECEGMYVIYLENDDMTVVQLSSINEAYSIINDFYDAENYDVLSKSYNIEIEKNGYISEDLIVLFPIDKLNNIEKYEENNWNGRFWLLTQLENEITRKIETDTSGGMRKNCLL